jgi:hypothetical protein
MCSVKTTHCSDMLTTTRDRRAPECREMRMRDASVSPDGERAPSAFRAQLLDPGAMRTVHDGQSADTRES